MSLAEQSEQLDAIALEQKDETEPKVSVPAPTESTPNLGRAEEFRVIVLLIGVLLGAFVLTQTHLGGDFGKVLGGMCLLGAVSCAGWLVYHFRDA